MAIRIIKTTATINFVVLVLSYWFFLSVIQRHMQKNFIRHTRPTVNFGCNSFFRPNTVYKSSILLAYFSQVTFYGSTRIMKRRKKKDRSGLEVGLVTRLY